MSSKIYSYKFRLPTKPFFGDVIEGSARSPLSLVIIPTVQNKREVVCFL